MLSAHSHGEVLKWACQRVPTSPEVFVKQKHPQDRDKLQLLTWEPGF